MAPYASPLRNTQKIRVPRSMDVQDPTLRFFLEGEELEAETRRASLESARGFENDNGAREAARTRDTLILRDRDLGSLNPYEQFENHARTRGALIGLALLTSLGAMGVAAWMWATSPTRPGLEWVQQRTAPAVAAVKAAFSPAPAAPQPGQPAEPAPATAPAAAPATETAQAATVPAATPEPAAAAPEIAPTAAAAPAAAVAPVVEPIPSERVAPPADDGTAPVASNRTAADAPARANHGTALRGYVWSPAAKTLVTSTDAPAAPATPVKTAEVASPGTTATEATVAEPAAAPRNPDAPMPSSLLTGPGIAAPSTGPAPDETARVPTTEPAAFPAPALTDTKAPTTPSATSPSTVKSSAPIIE